MQFDSETSQFINTNFFEAEAKDEKSYQTIRTIFNIFIGLPFATFIVLSYLALAYSDRIAVYAMRYIMVGHFMLSSKEKISSSFWSFFFADDYDANCNGHGNNPENVDGEDDGQDGKSDRKATILRISFAFIFLTLTLFAFHITACVKLIQYGNEVLYQHEDYDAGSLTDDGESTRNDRGLPISYVVVSLFFGVIIILTWIVLQLMIILYCGFCKSNTDQASPVSTDNEVLGAFAQVSLGGFVGYLGFYFAPYMLLAFIHDPIKTTFIYMMGALFIVCLYFLIKSIADCYSASASSSHLRLIQKLELLFAFGSGTSLAYFLMIVIFLFMLGNFDDFQAVHNLTLPIIIVLVPVLVLKPLYGNFFKPSGENNVTNETNTATNPTRQNSQQMNNVINNDDAQE